MEPKRKHIVHDEYRRYTSDRQYSVPLSCPEAEWPQELFDAAFGIDCPEEPQTIEVTVLLYIPPDRSSSGCSDATLLRPLSPTNEALPL